MKTLKLITILGLFAALCFAQQNTLVQTSLSNAITATQTSFVVGSATGINAPGVGQAGSSLFVVDLGRTIGETMKVVSLSGTSVTVQRGGPGKASAHGAAAMVLVGTSPNWFHTIDPTGTCTAANMFVTPWLNVTTGNQWVCSSVTGTYVPGWGNNIGTPEVTVLVASVAGTTAVNSPRQHTNGTNAITAWQPSVGWNGQDFCVLPDAAWTTTTGGTSVASTRVTAIAVASTAVANRTICFTYDATNNKFLASY